MTPEDFAEKRQGLLKVAQRLPAHMTGDIDTCLRTAMLLARAEDELDRLRRIIARLEMSKLK